MEAAPDRARQFLYRFRASLERHAASGLAGQPADHIAPECRACHFGQYVAIVRVTDTTLQVLHVFHASRNIAALLAAD
jgi:plasmid stabilization system protein ParE